jgi:hypothetical protein
MWTTVLNWIISPTGRKTAICAVIAIALFVGVRWYGNRQWAQGAEEGFVRAVTKIERVKRAEWAERERDIAAKEAQAKQRLQDLTQAAQAVHAARAVLIKNFDVTLKELEADRVESYRYAGSVPDADLIAALRAASGALADAGDEPGHADAAGTPSDTRTAP